MAPSWSTLTDGCVGNWRIAELLREHGGGADYIAESEGRRVWLRVLPSTAAAVKHSWDLARQSGIHDLVGLIECGFAELGGVGVCFAVLELPDDSLSQILAERRVDTDEASEIVRVATRCLSELHSRSLCHGSITPADFYIVDGQIKMGVDTLHLFSEEGRASDFRQLGRTLLVALTGRTGTDALREVPEALRKTVMNCLRAERSGVTAETLNRTARDVRETPRRSSRLPLALAAAGLVLVAGVLTLRDTRDKAVVPQPPSQPPAPIVVVEKPSPSEPRKVAELPASKISQPALPAGQGGGSTTWAIIAATYRDHEAAAKRARAIAQSSPRLRASVYPQPGAASRYYVLLGSGMTRERAEELLRDAREMGAPRDAYVTKLSN